MPSERAAVFTPIETAEDKLGLIDLLGAPAGELRPLELPTSAVRHVGQLGINAEIVIGIVDRSARTVHLLRGASVHAPVSSDQAVGLSIRLGALVAGTASSLIRAYFADYLREAATERLILNAPPVGPAADQAEAWRRHVDAVLNLTSTDFDSAAFVRCSPPQMRDDHWAIAVESYAPRASAAAIEASLIRLVDQNGSDLVVEDLRSLIDFSVPPGAESIRIEVSGRLRGEVRVELPAVVRPTAPNHVAPTEVVRRDRPNPVQVRELVEFAETRLGATGLPLAELAIRLEELTGTEAYLAVTQARGFFEGGDFGRAAEALRRVPDAERSPAADGLLLVCELGLGHVDLEVQRFERALFDDRLFPALIDAVEGLPPGPRDEAAELLSRVLSAQRAAAVINRVRPLLMPGLSLARIAKRIAAASPNDAIELLERSAPLDELPTEAIETLVDLRIAIGQAGVADAVSVLVDRQLVGGTIGAAVSVIERSERHMYPAGVVAIAERVLASLRQTGRDLDDDELLYALTVVAAIDRAVRVLRLHDLPEAIATLARLRAGLAPVPPELDQVISPLESDLFEAWEATAIHRSAIAEQEDSLIGDVAEAWRDRRLLVVGGRTPPWWEELRAEIGLSDRSVWLPSEPGHRPSMTALKATVAGGKLDLVVVIVDFIAHATSAIGDFAEERGVSVVEARSGRLSLLTALRAGRLERDQAHSR